MPGLDVGNACPDLEGNVFASDSKMRRDVRGLKRDFEDLKDYFEDGDFEGVKITGRSRTRGGAAGRRRRTRGGKEEEAGRRR